MPTDAPVARELRLKKATWDVLEALAHRREEEIEEVVERLVDSVLGPAVIVAVDSSVSISGDVHGDIAGGDISTGNVRTLNVVAVDGQAERGMSESKARRLVSKVLGSHNTSPFELRTRATPMDAPEPDPDP